jgi:hypothetical protein
LKVTAIFLIGQVHPQIHHNEDREPLVADPPSLNAVLSAIDLDDIPPGKDILAEQLSMRLS